jgi:acyl carrier protein
MEDLQTLVHDAVREVAQQRTPEVEGVSDGQRLTGELGLRSLDLAQLVAILELRTGLDPFAAHVAITSVRTVGDIVAAYRLAAGGAPAAAAQAPAQGEERAARRQAAGHRRRSRSGPEGERP